MDPKLFRQRLEQLAKLKVIKEPRTAGRREAEDADSIWRNGEEFLIDPKDNPTLGCAIDCIHPKTEACEDCGNIVTDRVVYIKVCDFPKPHWRESCQACKKTRNPVTGEFDLTSVEASNTYRILLNENPQYNTMKYSKPAK